MKILNTNHLPVIIQTHRVLLLIEDRNVHALKPELFVKSTFKHRTIV